MNDFIGNPVFFSHVLKFQARVRKQQYVWGLPNIYLHSMKQWEWRDFVFQIVSTQNINDD